MLLFVATSKLSVARCRHEKEPGKSLGIVTYLLFSSSYAESWIPAVMKEEHTIIRD
jgi:hypothetical protein